MDQWKQQHEGFFQQKDGACAADASQRKECEARSSIAARKVQKADREKMRRDRLNEQFQELGNALDPDRPRNDKATILGDAIQMLKDLTSQVNRLKAEYASLSEESHELTQEKNELRDEKGALKSEVDSLNAQYQQRLRVLNLWAGMEPSIVMGPPPAYPFPVPVPIPSGAVPMHPSLQAYPFFQNQTPGTIPNPCSPYMPYTQPCRPLAGQPVNQPNTAVLHSNSNRSQSPDRQDCRSKSSTHQQASCGERSDDFSDVATELELKTPGSAAPSNSEVANDKGSSSGTRKKKQCLKQMKGSTLTEGSTSSRCSSSGVPESSSSVGDGSVADDQ